LFTQVSITMHIDNLTNHDDTKSLRWLPLSFTMES